MHISVTVDYREKKLIECITKRLGSNKVRQDQQEKERAELGLKTKSDTSNHHIKWTEANLEVGDIQLAVIGDLGQTQAWMIIERKTHADMVASIKDGRYKEQKMRLSTAVKNAAHPARYMYILEGMQINSNEIPQLMGGWISTQFRDNIVICRTISVDETCELIIRLAERMYKNFGELFTVSNQASNSTDAATKKVNVGSSANKEQLQQLDNPVSPPDENTKTITLQPANGKAVASVAAATSMDESGSDSYLEALAGSLKTKKKDNLTPELCQQLMVCNIPGISSALAVPIIQHFGTLGKLVAYVHNSETTTEEKQKAISAIKIQTSTGKTRTIGPVAAGKVLQYLA